jgi:Gas vesicle protein K
MRLQGTLVEKFPPDSPGQVEPAVETEHAAEFVAELRRVADALPERVNIDAQSVEQGLAKLVLTLIELIRRLLEKQAVRRMEGGGLTDEQVEQLGLALMKLEEKMGELKAQFGLEDEELNIDLGPIGRLI